MPIANAHDGDPFSFLSLTAALEREPYVPGQIGRMNLFEEDSVSTTSISIEQLNGRIGLVEPTERGGAGVTVGDETRSHMMIRVPHYQVEDTMRADEVQNIRQFGSTTELETVLGRVHRKQARLARYLAATLEHQRIGAIKGHVTSKGGKTIANLYTLFGKATPAATSLSLSTESTKVGALFDGVRHKIEDALDSAYEGLHVFTGRNFHTKLWQHKSVYDTYLYGPNANVLRDGTPDVFEFAGATWERYKTGKAASDDLGAAYIHDDKARVVPRGVPELFITRFAPADYIDTVNQDGKPLYSLLIERLDRKGFEVQVQMNAISVCTIPEVLQELTI